jgi:hypothetical protein
MTYIQEQEWFKERERRWHEERKRVMETDEVERLRDEVKALVLAGDPLREPLLDTIEWAIADLGLRGLVYDRVRGWYIHVCRETLRLQLAPLYPSPQCGRWDRCNQNDPTGPVCECRLVRARLGQAIEKKIEVLKARMEQEYLFLLRRAVTS